MHWIHYRFLSLKRMHFCAFTCNWTGSLNVTWQSHLPGLVQTRFVSVLDGTITCKDILCFQNSFTWLSNPQRHPHRLVFQHHLGTELCLINCFLSVTTTTSFKPQATTYHNWNLYNAFFQTSQEWFARKEEPIDWILTWQFYTLKHIFSLWMNSIWGMVEDDEMTLVIKLLFQTLWRYNHDTEAGHRWFKRFFLLNMHVRLNFNSKSSNYFLFLSKTTTKNRLKNTLTMWN